MLRKNPTTAVVVMGNETPQVKQAVAVAEQVNANAGKVDVSNGSIIEWQLIPTFSKVNVSNPNNANSALLPMAFVFNEKILKNSQTDNVYPVGAVSADMIQVVYNDGFSGRYIDRLIQMSNDGRGLFCEELTIIGKNAAGVQTDDAILALDAAIQSYNSQRGDALPANLDLSEAIRSTAFKNGFVTVKLAFWMNFASQFTFPITKGYTYELKFKWATK